MANPPPQPLGLASDWLICSWWAWPPGEGKSGRKARSPGRRGCLGDAGGALGGGEASQRLNDKSAGDCWGPAPGGGEGEGGAGLRAAGSVRTAEAARDGSQVRVPVPRQARSGRGGARAGEVGCSALRSVTACPRALRVGCGGRRRATRGCRPRSATAGPLERASRLPRRPGAEEMGAAPQPLPFRRSFPFPTNGLCFHFLPFRASSPSMVHFLSPLVAAVGRVRAVVSVAKTS